MASFMGEDPSCVLLPGTRKELPASLVQKARLGDLATGLRSGETHRVTLQDTAFFAIIEEVRRGLPWGLWRQDDNLG